MKHLPIFCAVVACAAAFVIAQDAPPPPDDRPAPPAADGRPPRGFGPPGGMMQSERKIVKQFDKDGDKRLNKDERAEAREFLKKDAAAGGGRRGGFPGGRGGEENNEPPKPGERISPADVMTPEITALFAPNVLRTLFLDFEGDDWEAEMTDFHGTDVEMPATLTVDGVKHPGVGVHFRGASSYFMVKAGRKRSLNVSLDFTDKKQRLDGYKTLNLLNAHDDAAFLGPVLYSHIARQYLPAPKANLVRVVINGESWGVYVNQQQFDKDFVQENFRTEKGVRWKVRGSPMGGGGLDFIGDDVAEYKKHYDMKSNGDDEDWKALVELCRTLSQTPVEQLEAALAPKLDLDGLLWFLAVDNALINCDGYWIRASDYSLYRDKGGKFHVIPADMNEAFRTPQGPGMGRGPGRGGPPGGEPQPGGPPGFGGGMQPVKGVELDPLVGLDDAKKPLRSRVLAVSALRARYLAHIRTIANDSLDWQKLGPLVAQYRALIEKEVEADTRKLTTFAAFQKAAADAPAETAEPEGRRPGTMSLRAFADQRRAYLLSLPAMKETAP